MTAPTPINFDKLRNAVQKFGSMSFTTAQISADYYRNDGDIPAPFFEKILHQHAALLGIRPQTSDLDKNTIWQSL